ncbi:MAG: hypothetical protein R3244_13550 [Thermoanaerobaculia bacterium]|nr:hypothetical protein [Thermoanaerobaculia bacterium]
MRFAEILRLPDSAARTAAIAEWIQSLYEDEVPILVGGAAVELYTGGAYSTGDLDFVGHVPASVDSALRAHGFTRDGRHWIHEEGRVFVEFPGASLGEGERAAEIEIDGHRVRLLAPEALVVDRLAAWQFWRSEEDAANALLVARAVATDPDALQALGERREVVPALERLIEALERWSETDPNPEELIEWARRPPTE